MLTKFHRWNACLLGLFLALHLGSHLFLIGGRGAHLWILERLHPVYGSSVVTGLIVALFAVQIVLGVGLVRKRGKPDNGWGWAQVISGGYLALFLVQHVPAILSARAQDIETNTFFAAAVLRWPLGLYFGPYYALALLAMATHIAAFLRFRVWPAPAGPLARGLPVAGGLFGVLAVLGLMGVFGGPEIPASYLTWLGD